MIHLMLSCGANLEARLTQQHMRAAEILSPVVEGYRMQLLLLFRATKLHVDHAE
jgi:hypothetical protein